LRQRLESGAGDASMKSKKKKKMKTTKQSRAEAAHYVKTLEANRQIAHGKKMTPGTTHQMVTGAKGKKTLVRRRYSAI
jgi:hypothetical protein